MWQTIKDNPISTIAVALVTVIAMYIGYMNYWLTEVLAGPGFCGKAYGVDKLAAGNERVSLLQGCIGLLTEQIGALAVNSHIFAGTFALVLIVLTVVVIAGAKLAFKAGKDGISGNVSRDVGEAADEVADAAADKAEEIKGEG